MKTELLVNNQAIALPRGNDIIDLEKHISIGDKFVFNGKTYKIVDKIFHYDSANDTYWAQIIGA